MDQNTNDQNATNPPAEPAYSAPMQEQTQEKPVEEIVLPEQPTEDDNDAFDDEVGTAEDVQADFDAEETNPKEASS